MKPVTVWWGCILLFLSLSGCQSISSERYVGKVYTAVVINQQSEEVFIGQTIHEYNRPTNAVITNEAGIFSLPFIGIIPVITLTGFYEPISLIAYPGFTGIDTIRIGSRNLRRSQRLRDKASRALNRSRKDFSLQSTWVVDTIIAHKNRYMEHYEEYEPNFHIQQLRSLIPNEFARGDTLDFRRDGLVYTGKHKPYRYDHRGEYFSLLDGDAVIQFSWYLINSNTMTWVRDDEYGAIECRLELIE